jgi:hypothetical protein
MTDFAEVVKRHMQRRDMSLRATAAAAHYDPGMLSKVLNGKREATPYLAGRLDDALGAEGEIRAARPGQPKPRKLKPASTQGQPSGAVLAIQATMTGDPAELDIAADGLAELVSHYARAVAVVPSAMVYDELASARAFAGSLLGRTAPKGRPELAITAGWLSSLLAVSATDLGDQAAALVWCADAERRGRDTGFPELLGWAALTRAAIAYYQGDPARSAAIARKGQGVAPEGSVASMKLTAQEMRCLALLGDLAGMAGARKRAMAAMASIRPGADVGGIYSSPRADDPPYTATSLLLAGRHAEAAEMTRRIIATAYQPRARPDVGQPTNYARTLLILALAAAGLGNVDEAAAHGAAALDAGRVVWPTMVLAGKLASAIERRSPGSSHATGFRERYIDAGRRLALPAAPSGEAG